MIIGGIDMNLKQARKNKGMTQTEVAKALGINQNTYSYWENGKTKIDNESLAKLSDLFEVSIDYLLGISNSYGFLPEPHYYEKDKNGNYTRKFADINKIIAPHKKGIKIPVLGRVQAGIPIEAIEEIIDYEEITEEMARKGEHFALKVQGNSMDPQISEGDVVIVRKCSDCESGTIAVVLVNGKDATVKRIKKRPEGIMLIPANPAYEAMFYTNEEIASLPLAIIGKVVEQRRSWE